MNNRKPRLKWNELTAILDNPIAFHRIFATIGGGAVPGLFLSQAFYWTKRTRDPDGWFYKSMAEWTLETALTRDEQETARKRLIARGLLETERRGVPCTVHFRLIKDAILIAIEDSAHVSAEDIDDGGVTPTTPPKQKAQAGQVSRQYAGKHQTEFVENPQTGTGKSTKLVRGKPADKPAQKPQTHRETTRDQAESTSERRPSDFNNSLSDDALRAAERAYRKLNPASKKLIDALTASGRERFNAMWEHCRIEVQKEMGK